jgi:hypothetical protein
VPHLVHGQHLLVLQLLPAPVHGAQLYLMGAVHFEEQSFLHVIVKTSDSKVRVIHNSSNIIWVAILLDQVLFSYVMY